MRILGLNLETRTSKLIRERDKIVGEHPSWYQPLFIDIWWDYYAKQIQVFDSNRINAMEYANVMIRKYIERYLN